MLFVALWVTVVYFPIAHMVWYWDGPDAITDAASLEKVTAGAWASAPPIEMNPVPHHIGRRGNGGAGAPIG